MDSNKARPKRATARIDGPVPVSIPTRHQWPVSNCKRTFQEHIPTERHYIAPGVRDGAQTTSETLIRSAPQAGFNDRGKAEEEAKLGANAEERSGPASEQGVHTEMDHRTRMGMSRRPENSWRWAVGSTWRQHVHIRHVGPKLSWAACQQSTTWAGGISTDACAEEMLRDRACRHWTRCAPLQCNAHKECRPPANGERTQAEGISDRDRQDRFEVDVLDGIDLDDMQAFREFY